jgi:hypothetical protein
MSHTASEAVLSCCWRKELEGKEHHDQRTEKNPKHKNIPVKGTSKAWAMKHSRRMGIGCTGTAGCLDQEEFGQE